MNELIEIRLLDAIRDLDPENKTDPMLTFEVDLIDGGYIDSFGMVELIVLIKDEWGVDLGGADFYAKEMRCISGIASTIKSLEL
jgi:acyl carrier protein